MALAEQQTCHTYPGREVSDLSKVAETSAKKRKAEPAVANSDSLAQEVMRMKMAVEATAAL
eukprot:Skav205266  [mRNA]  locus=scaffold1841:160249:165678:- [translate_table: standard]